MGSRFYLSDSDGEEEVKGLADSTATEQ